LLQQLFFAFCVITSYINLLLEIVFIINIPRKARGPDFGDRWVKTIQKLNHAL